MKQILTSTGLEPHSLKLEITESLIMENPEAARALLLQLKALDISRPTRRLGIFGRSRHRKARLVSSPAVTVLRAILDRRLMVPGWLLSLRWVENTNLDDCHDWR